MKISHNIYTDVLIVGGGVAATRSALASVEAGAKTIMVLKKTLGKSGSTNWPRKGIYGSAWQAADGCGGTEDSPEIHFKDIMDAALGMADAKLAKILSEESPDRLKELDSWGFDLVEDPDNKKPHYSGYSCFASQPRAHGMKANKRGGHTGNLIDVMSKRLKNFGAEIHESITVIDLLVKDNTCYGALCINEDGEFVKYNSGSVILGTGGAAQIFPLSTTPGDITGDGYAMALRVGASLTNLEFMQYMIRTIYSRSKELQQVLDSQVGGTFWTLNPKIIDSSGKDILRDLLPNESKVEDSFEMRTHHYPFSSRDISKWIDIVIQRCIRSGKGSDKGGVTIDFSEVDLSNKKQSRPQHSPPNSGSISLGDDPIKQINVNHSAHAVNGGIKVDEFGATDINGLFAVGETIAGPHGADRLGGGMISQSNVFGARAGKIAAKFSIGSDHIDSLSSIDRINKRLSKFKNLNAPNYYEIRKKLKALAAENLIVERNQKGLDKMYNHLEELSQEIIFKSPYHDTKSMLKNLETENLLTVAKLMVGSARLRKESRGSHCRFDYPEIDNYTWDKSIFWSIKEDKIQYEIKKFRQDFDDCVQVI